MIKDSDQCFDFLLSNNNLHSIAVGMQSKEEVTNNG